MQEAYQKLCTQFYDRSKPRAGEREIAFYTDILKDAAGPFLDAMCGSGRLLIPLLEKGFLIDGVDDSSEMLKSCAERCKALHLPVNLYNQSLQALSIPKKYGAIFIAVGSFQLIENRVQVLQVLKKLRDHLLPGKSLFLELFIPWDVIKDSIEDGILKEKTTKLFEKKVTFPDGVEINYTGKTTAYLNEQLEISEGIYEKTFQHKILESEKERLAVRWYHRYEMELLLRESGFSQVRIGDASFELNPQATIYQAIKILKV
jgi:SAM-dependent methyltransferase